MCSRVNQIIGRTCLSSKPWRSQFQLSAPLTIWKLAVTPAQGLDIGTLQLAWLTMQRLQLSFLKSSGILIRPECRNFNFAGQSGKLHIRSCLAALQGRFSDARLEWMLERNPAGLEKGLTTEMLPTGMLGNRHDSKRREQLG